MPSQDIVIELTVIFAINFAMMVRYPLLSWPHSCATNGGR